MLDGELSVRAMIGLLSAGAAMALLQHWVAAHPEDGDAQELRKYLRGRPLIQAIVLDIGCGILIALLLRRLFL
jgi:hypothetical protein